MASAPQGGAASAEESAWTFSAGIDYSSGDYGSEQDTDIISAPFSASYGASRWRLGVTVSYVSVEGAPGVVPGSGGAFSGGGPLSSVTNPLLGSGGPTGSPLLAPAISEQGLGDVTVEFSVTPYIADNGARLSLLGATRLPTGDEERSLGAGETILSMGAGGAHPLGERTSIYGAVGYAYASESGEDGPFASGGLESRVLENVLIGVSADWAEASIADAPERTQVTLYSAFDLNSTVRLGAYASAGLSDAAPDTGAGLRLVLH